MVRPAPNSFNPEQVARQPETMSVAFPLSRCKRLVALMAVDSGELAGEITVSRIGERLVVRGKYSTRYMLECQRCLQSFEYPIDANFELTLVADQSAADALPEELDPLIVGEDGMLDVVDIFEDELILQIPTVPRHTSVEQCSFAVQVDVEVFAGDGPGETKPGSEPEPPKQRGQDVFAELKKLRFDD